MRTPLADPAPLAKDALRIVPLGGLGEVGRNMTVFEFGGKLLIVDVGVLDNRNVRLPLVPASDELVDELRSVLGPLGLLEGA